MRPEIETADERLARVAARLRAGVDCAEADGSALAGQGGPVLAVHTFRVRHGDRVRAVTVLDPGVRPPDPGGVWLDDLLSASCRVLFGETRGSCRPVQGTDQFEFRPHWPDPTRYKVAERVGIDIVRAGRVEKSDTVVVQTAAYPGADIPSVVFCSACQLCERRFGPGRLSWAPGRDHRLRYEPGAVAAGAAMVPCRYTVHRAGGAAADVVVSVPGRATRQWEAITLVLAVECRRRFGAGRLSYMPELGEVSFGWK